MKNSQAFSCCFTALSLGTRARAEDATSHGRIDMTVLFEKQASIFKFKVMDLDQPTGTALAQIKALGYADKYRFKACHEYGHTQTQITAAAGLHYSTSSKIIRKMESFKIQDLTPDLKPQRPGLP